MIWSRQTLPLQCYLWILNSLGFSATYFVTNHDRSSWYLHHRNFEKWIKKMGTGTMLTCQAFVESTCPTLKTYWQMQQSSYTWLPRRRHLHNIELPRCTVFKNMTFIWEKIRERESSYSIASSLKAFKEDSSNQCRTPISVIGTQALVPSWFSHKIYISRMPESGTTGNPSIPTYDAFPLNTLLLIRPNVHFCVQFN